MNRKRNISAARWYLSWESIRTIADSSSSSPYLSQNKHMNPTSIYSALLPKNAKAGSATLHQDQYPAMVIFATTRTSVTTPNTRKPLVSIGLSRLPLTLPRGHSISANRPAAHGIAASPASAATVVMAQERATSCPYPGDSVPDDNEFRNDVAPV
jgi:hypothetical protein